MSTAVRVALIGFTKFEHATFESFFRLAAKRTPAYVLCERVADCGAAVVNADNTAGVADVRNHDKLHCALMLGATPQPGAAQQLPRPINLMLVVRALDSLVMQQSQQSQQAQPSARAAEPQGEPAPEPVSRSVQRVLADLVHVTTAIPAGVNPRALAATAAAAAPVFGIRAEASMAPPGPAASAPPPSAAAPAPAPPTRAVAAPAPAAPNESDRPGMDHILVVDDSDIALRFMANNLQRFGFQVHLARSGAEAIERVAKRHFEFVFLDVMMQGMDGFYTCKTIKRSTYPDNRPPPTVVMLTSRGTAVDKMRGTMAGADAYLTKPLQESELLKVVGDREVAKHAYAETAQAANTLI